ncbi:MAG: hypothetical protein QE278_06290 [Limnobacter sp.]|nr:hypothetical protein [Limnobacter sp.]
MTQPILNQEALDASNRALGLLAGATPQSFSKIGYGFADSVLTSGLTASTEGAGAYLASIFSSDLAAPALPSQGSSLLLKTVQDVGTASPLPLQLYEADPASSLVGSAAFNNLNADSSEMDDAWQSAASSLTPSSLDDSSALLNAQPDASTLVDSSSAFVSDLLADLLARLSSNDAVAPELTGENQAAFRMLLDSLGESLDGSARDFFQSNVQGQVKAITGGVIDSLGVEALDPVVNPIQDFDYYGTSADFIQDTRTALSLSSIALPPIGPTVAWVRDDLIQTFNA